MERVVRVVDLVHRPVLGAELRRLPFQAVKLGVGQQPA